ncbi:MAG: hypothetical protein KBF21_00300 [Thermoanaerobaculia bacterium]|nr:hypothetical protein [Thermoanaerobaculia bacterium]MBP9822636.1 hypothetical protein [Thermoanaerobaculia bacterium]
MPSNRANRSTRGWYTVSVDTVRGAVIVASFAALALVGYSLYRQWAEKALQEEAAAVLNEVEGLLARADIEQPAGSFVEELESARRGRATAAAAFEAGEFATALGEGRRSRALLLAVLDSAAARESTGEAQFIAVQGSVEVRRGERGEWEEARSRVVLQSGDYVKTSANGSAEIVFLDGTLYNVRPNTLFLVTRQPGSAGAPAEQTIAMEYGWVNLNTAQRGGRVTTPRAEALVGRESDVVVSYDKASSTGRFSAFRGALEVASNAGLKRTVGELEQVVQTGDLLSEARRLPGAPQADRPPDNVELSLAAVKTLVLSWEPVDAAARYALQVSRNRLFVDNIIDVNARTKTEATLGLKGEGTFEWRVAAVGRDGLQGPWSPPRTFRVRAAEQPGEKGDKTPPELVVDQVQAYGNIFIVAGRTEAGAVMKVNGEQVAVTANGTFTKTVLVGQEGWSILELRSTDPSGNESTVRQRVFVETL